MGECCPWRVTSTCSTRRRSASFIAGVREEIARARSPQAACDAIRPAFAALLADPAWLPERYQEGDPGARWAAGSGSGCCSAPATAR